MEVHGILVTGKKWGGGPKISGTCFEDPYNEDYSIWGSIIRGTTLSVSIIQ